MQTPSCASRWSMAMLTPIGVGGWHPRRVLRRHERRLYFNGSHFPVREQQVGNGDPGRRVSARCIRQPGADGLGNPIDVTGACARGWPRPHTASAWRPSRSASRFIFDWAWRTLWNRDWEDYVFAAAGGSHEFRRPQFKVWIGYDLIWASRASKACGRASKNSASPARPRQPCSPVVPALPSKATQHPP